MVPVTCTTTRGHFVVGKLAHAIGCGVALFHEVKEAWRLQRGFDDQANAGRKRFGKACRVDFCERSFFGRR